MPKEYPKRVRQKLKIAIVDDDKSLHKIIHNLYGDSGIIDIKYNFTDSRKFIDEVPLLDFDLCFLEIDMHAASGLVVAQLLNNRPFIFITRCYDKLKDALALEPVDIVTKPFNKERLDHAIERVHKLIGARMEYALFNVAESNGKVKIHLPAVLYVKTDETDPRHKAVVLKGSIKYTIMDCSLEEILSMAPTLVQINRRELIALDIINEMVYDVISVHEVYANNIPKELSLGPAYKKNLFKRVFYK